MLLAMVDAPDNRDQSIRKPSLRWRVLKWGAVGSVVLLLFAGGIWLAWLAGANRQLRLAKEEARSAGLPVTPAELLADLEVVPAELDIAPDVMETAALIDTTSPTYVTWNEQRSIPASERTATEQAAFTRLRDDVVVEQSAVLDRLATLDAKIPPATTDARANLSSWIDVKGQVDAGESPEMLEVLLPHASDFRTVATLVAANTDVAMEAGDGTTAVQNWLRLLGMADALDNAGHTLIEHLVANGICRLVTDGIQRAAHEHPATLAASSENVRSALHARLTKTVTARAWRQVFAGELVMVNDMFESMVDGRPATGIGMPSWASTSGRPLLRGDQAQVLRWFLEHAEAADASTLPNFLAQVTPEEQAFDFSGFSPNVFAIILIPSLDQAADVEYRSRVDLAAADVALAIAEYRADHDDQLPPTLDALVPAYLPAVPRDALAADAALQYDPARGLLWSVGQNMIDDGGSNAVLPGTRRRPPSAWDRLDLLYPLTLDAEDALNPADE